MSTICILAGIFVVLCVASYADAYDLSSVTVTPSQNASLASPTALAVVASRYQLPPREFACTTEFPFAICEQITPAPKPTTNVLLSVTSYQSTSDASSEDASKTAAPAPEPTSLRPLPAPTSSNSPDSTTESSSASLSSASPDSTTESNSASLSYASPSVSSTTSSSGAASHTKVPSITTPSAPGVRSASASSSDSVVPAATTATSIQSKGISPTPVSANATSPRSDVRTWVTVLIIACVVLILLLVFIGIWLLRRRRAGHLARDFTSFVAPSKDSLTFVRLSETSHSSFGVARQRPRLPSIHCDGNRESALAAPCSAEQRHTAYVTSDPSDATSVAAVFDHPLLDHYTRPPTRLSGRPTLRLSLENIDDFLRHSNALPSSTTWQSPQLPPHNVSPKLAARPPSSVFVVGRLSWHSALTPRTTMSRSVVNELPSWPARPASHARPRGPRAQGERGTRTLDRDQDIADSLQESTVSPSRRRADDGGVRLAGGPLPPVGQDAPPGDKGSSEGRVSSDSSGGSSEVTLPPAYAMY